jgi:pimeloyl-ACP methyl ester carboxylesterase
MCDRRLWSFVEADLVASGRRLVQADLSGADTIAGIGTTVLANAPEKFIAVGLSMGGIVAFELMRQQPSRVAALILCDTNPAPEQPERAEARRAQQRAVENGRLRDVIRDELKPAYLAPSNRHRRDILDVAFDMAMDLGPEVFLRQSRALLTRPDSRPDLAAIGCPSLILCGAEDPVCPPAWHLDMADAIPGAELQLIDGAGHLPPLEQPTSFSKSIVNWVRGRD